MAEESLVPEYKNEDLEGHGFKPPAMTAIF